ncbi:hypothetical protein ABK040_011808 [Willaertia magna]
MDCLHNESNCATNSSTNSSTNSLTSSLTSSFTSSLTTNSSTNSISLIMDTLNDHSPLNANRQIISRNGKYRAVMQSDGNFICYDNSNNKSFWESGTSGKGQKPHKLVIEEGHLIIYDSFQTVIWQSSLCIIKSAIDKPKGPFRLVMQDDRNLVLFDDGSNKSIWSSKTKI